MGKMAPTAAIVCLVVTTVSVTLNLSTTRKSQLKQVLINELENIQFIKKITDGVTIT